MRYWYPDQDGKRVYYVYELMDPRDEQIFYVGKGHGNRVIMHEREARKWIAAGRPERQITNPEKFHRIVAILDSGHSVLFRTPFFTHSEEEAFRLERERIKEIGIKNLTNVDLGRQSRIVGVGFTVTIDDAVSMRAAADAERLSLSAWCYEAVQAHLRRKEEQDHDSPPTNRSLSSDSASSSFALQSSTPVVTK